MATESTGPVPSTDLAEYETIVKRQELQFPNWCVTVNSAIDYGFQVLASLVETGVAKWVIFGDEEAPTTGHRHLQGYVQFTKRKRKTEVCKILHGAVAHWEPAGGTHEHNYKYCTKTGEPGTKAAPGPLGSNIEQGKFYEFGERPKFETAGEREQGRWDGAREAAVAGEWENVDSQIMVCHYKSLKTLHNDFRKKAKVADWHGKVELQHRFRWYYGEPGCGKTRHVYDLARSLEREVYVKAHNKWWCGYQEGQVVLMDDVNQDAKWLGDFIKLWCQEYPFQAETKGGMATIRPEYIFFTSNYHPHDIFTDKAMRESVDRRMLIEFIGSDPTYIYVGPQATVKFNLPSANTTAVPLNDPFKTPVRPKTPGVPPAPRLVRARTIMPNKPVEVVDLSQQAEDEQEEE